MLGAPVRDLVQPRALELLADSKRWTEGKQQLTAATLYTMLCGEGFDVGYAVVKDIVHDWKRQEVFVPLVYNSATSARSTSSRSSSTSVASDARLDGHVGAFSHFGAVPHRLVYDNLKAAVRKIVVERDAQRGRR